MAASGIGYPEQEADFRAIRKAMKQLNHSDWLQLKLAKAAEAALDRIEEAITATLAAQAAASKPIKDAG